MSFEIFDVVRVERLIAPTREVDGDSSAPPQPRVGDMATVVGALGGDMYLVERTTDDGSTLWVAEFEARELTLVDRQGAPD